MVDVQLMEVPSETVAVVHRHVPADRLPQFFAEAFAKVAEVVVTAGGRVSGPPFGWYRAMPGPDGVDVTAGFPVAGDVHGTDGGVVLAERPGGRALVAVHAGPYDSLAGTWADVDRRAEQEKLTLRGDAWEEYLSEPEGDPGTWLTRVVRPVG